MCESTSEVSLVWALKAVQESAQKALQESAKEEGKKDSAEGGDGCCEPFCTPITCGP